MDMLKELVLLIKDLPDLAIWIITIFFAYKMFIVGSVYGVLRLAIHKAHDALTTEKKITYKYSGDLLDENAKLALDLLVNAIKKQGITGVFIRSSDIEAAQKAVEEHVRQGEYHKTPSN